MTTTMSKPKNCDCVKQANKLLAARNTHIDLATMIPCDGGRMFTSMQVPTAKDDPKKKGRPVRIQATYCPFCGAKYLPGLDV